MTPEHPRNSFLISLHSAVSDCNFQVGLIIYVKDIAFLVASKSKGSDWFADCHSIRLVGMGEAKDWLISCVQGHHFGVKDGWEGAIVQCVKAQAWQA